LPGSAASRWAATARRIERPGRCIGAGVLGEQTLAASVYDASRRIRMRRTGGRGLPDSPSQRLPTDLPSACGRGHVGQAFWSRRCAQDRIERDRIERDRTERDQIAQGQIAQDRVEPILNALSLRGRQLGGTGLPHRTGEELGRPTPGGNLAADRIPSRKTVPGAQCRLSAVDRPSADSPPI